MTRRTVALSLAVAVVWVTPVAGGQGPGSPPDASARSITIDEWRPADAGGGGSRTLSQTADTWTTSPAVDAGDAVLVGADWGGDHGTEVQVRAHDGEQWGRWTELHAHDEHGPDPANPEAASVSTASEPVWVGRSKQLQFRVQGKVDELDVDLVDIPGDLEYEPEVAGQGAAVAATEAPFIRPRSYWGADESIRTRKVSYADDVRFSVIHHVSDARMWTKEDIANGCKDAAAKINGIYEFHVRSRGMWDIAYNFIVDPCGRVWEGRAGGVDRAVMGAHAGGWNSGSVGVLALGCFVDNCDPVTNDMVAGIEDLLAWKLDIHHTNPRGTTREVSGGGSSRYPSGTAVNVPILSAHQITNSTTCPGAQLMGRLFNGQYAGATPQWSYTNNVVSKGLPKAYDRQPASWTASEAGDRPSWDVTLSEPVDWSLRITDEDGELVRATGGTAEERIERTWDLRDSRGVLVDAGTYTATITGVGDTGEITPVVTKLVVASTVARRMGGDRVGTSVALSKWAFDTADTAIVASSEAYPDALVSGPLAGSLDAPVLLSPQGDLPESVEEEIERLGAKTVYVIGGEVAIAADVVAELKSDVAGGVTVQRIGGPDRFATAAMVAARVAGDQPVSEVLLSLGHHENETSAFPDALSAGAFGADLRLPVLLTRRDQLPDATRQALGSMGPDTVTAFGGTVAIAPGVTTAAANVSKATVERFAGDTRYDTSRLAAEELLRRRGVLAPGETADDQPSDQPTDGSTEDSTATEQPSEESSSTEQPSEESSPTEQPSEPTQPTDDGSPIDLIFASGGNWPDALGAGAAAARTGTVFLLAHPETLDEGAATRVFLERWQSRIGDASVAGGPVAIKGAVLTAIAKYVATGETVETEPIEWPADPHAGA